MKLDLLERMALNPWRMVTVVRESTEETAGVGRHLTHRLQLPVGIRPRVVQQAHGRQLLAFDRPTA